MEENQSPDSSSTGHDAPAASARPASGSHHFYGRQSFTRSGWCGTCGLRRGADGRCSNCDAWWTSPLIQYGAPLIIASTFLLLMGVSLLRPKSSFLTFGKPPIAVPAPRGYSSIPVPSPASPGAMYQPIPVPPSRPTAYAPPPPIPVPNTVSYTAPAVPPTPEAMQEAALWANQRQLNRMAMSVNSAMQADDAARQQASHAVYSSGGQTITPASASSMGRPTTASSSGVL